jgi:membrane-bound ClpP family serine protease
MDPIALSLLLLAGGIVLLLGELLLPTQGVLGLFGLVCVAAAIGVTFYINRWLGLGIFLAAVVLSPLAWNLAWSLWERSPVGRRVLLPPIEPVRTVMPIKLGQTGVAISELRPMGECEFDEMRLEAISERGIIRPGQRVRVVAVTNGIPTVRTLPVESAAAESAA